MYVVLLQSLSAVHVVTVVTVLKSARLLTGRFTRKNVARCVT